MAKFITYEDLGNLILEQRFATCDQKLNSYFLWVHDFVVEALKRQDAEEEKKHSP